MAEPPVPWRRVRDLLILEPPGGPTWVIAADVAAGVGDKPGDAVAADPYVVGRFTARVALAELIAVRAVPVALAAPLGVEPSPTGERIREGIRHEVAEAGYDLPVTGSLERNLPVGQTSAGVVAFGVAPPEGLKLGPARAGDRLYVVGMPKVGAEVRLGDPEIVTLPVLRLFADCPRVSVVAPCGSGGIAAECEALAAELGVTWDAAGPPLPLRSSAGPCTCAVFAASDARVVRNVGPRICQVGRFTPPR